MDLLGVKISKDGLKRTLYESLGLMGFEKSMLHKVLPESLEWDSEILDGLKIESIYSKYEKRLQKDMALLGDDSLEFPEDIDYSEIVGLSSEISSKLRSLRPSNMSQLRAIEGVTPAAVVAISIFCVSVMEGDVFSGLDVPRGTLDLFRAYANEIIRWNDSVKLVSKKDSLSENSLMHRHIFDSLQIIDFIMNDDVVLDIGSGAGFPGFVIAALTSSYVTLIEPNYKKAAF